MRTRVQLWQPSFEVPGAIPADIELDAIYQPDSKCPGRPGYKLAGVVQVYDRGTAHPNKSNMTEELFELGDCAVGGKAVICAMEEHQLVSNGCVQNLLRR